MSGSSPKTGAAKADSAVSDKLATTAGQRAAPGGNRVAIDISFEIAVGHEHGAIAPNLGKSLCVGDEADDKSGVWLGQRPATTAETGHISVTGHNSVSFCVGRRGVGCFSPPVLYLTP